MYRAISGDLEKTRRLAGNSDRIIVVGIVRFGEICDCNPKLIAPSLICHPRLKAFLGCQWMLAWGIQEGLCEI